MGIPEESEHERRAKVAGNLLHISSSYREGGGGQISYTPNVKHMVGWTMRKVLPSVLKTLVLFQLHRRKKF